MQSSAGLTFGARDLLFFFKIVSWRLHVSLVANHSDENRIGQSFKDPKQKLFISICPKTVRGEHKTIFKTKDSIVKAWLQL